jgi:hypothetical protein
VGVIGVVGADPALDEAVVHGEREVMRRFSEEISSRQEVCLQISSHLQCWLTMESITCTNAS